MRPSRLFAIFWAIGIAASFVGVFMFHRLGAINDEQTLWLYCGVGVFWGCVSTYQICSAACESEPIIRSSTVERPAFDSSYRTIP